MTSHQAPPSGPPPPRAAMSRRPSMSFQSLQALENYEEGELIGQGSFGIIHKVKRKSDGMIFAQKQLNFSRMNQRDKQQLVAEVNILNKLSHPHIVGYVERILDPDRGIIYLIMEYCGGGDLSRLISECERTNQQFPEDTIWNYFCQIVQALGHCHSTGDEGEDGTGRVTPGGSSSRKSGKERERVLHRDLKPDNVFLDDNRENVKLGDFGLSKSMGAAAFANTYVGTPYYMSPELFSESAYDAKSDIWALGCVIYEMVALHPPFHQAKTHNDLANQLRSRRIPPLPRKVSSTLSQIIMKMLSFDPALRPSAKELMQLPMMQVQVKMNEMTKGRKLLNSRALQLNDRETTLVAREHAVGEREDRCSLQERKINHSRRTLEADREALKAEKAKWDEERRAASSASSESRSSSAGSGGAAEMEGVVEIAGPAKSVVSTAAASRVPRRSYVPVPRALEERFAPNPPVTTTARSRDSCVFDLNTPTKSAFSSIAPTSIRRGGPGTPSRLASKSMGNLAAAAKADRAREEESGSFDPRRDSSSNRASVGSPGEAKTLGRIGGGGATRRPSPILAHNPPPPPPPPSSQHQHNPFLGDHQPPSRTERTFARPPLPTSMHSMPVNLPTSSSSTTLSSDRPLFPNTPARYDHNDVENLPSPFLRRVEAATASSSSSHHQQQRPEPSTYNTAPTLRSSSSTSTRSSMPRSRSTVGLVAATGGGGGGNLARMAMGNAAASNVRGEVGAVKERPTMLQRVSRASGLERTASRDSLSGREREGVQT